MENVYEQDTREYVPHLKPSQFITYRDKPSGLRSSFSVTGVIN